MAAQTTPITERQLELITRAHGEAGDLIEPLLELKGGAKLKMIASLAQRGLIEQEQGRWRLTRAAIAIIKGEARAEHVLPPITAAHASPTPPAGESAPIEPHAEAEEGLPQADNASQAKATQGGRDHTKLERIIELLRSPRGATIGQMRLVTGWQEHSVRGQMSNIKKKMGLDIVSTKEGGERVYRIANA